MKWINLLSRNNFEFPKYRQRYLVVIRRDFITEAFFTLDITDIKDYNSDTKSNWIFRDKNYQDEFVEMYCELPDLESLRNDDDMPTEKKIKMILSSIDIKSGSNWLR